MVFKVFSCFAELFEKLRNHFDPNLTLTWPKRIVTNQSNEFLFLRAFWESTISEGFLAQKIPHSYLNIKFYKALETLKEVYTDEELMILLKKPEAKSSEMAEFRLERNWFPLLYRE